MKVQFCDLALSKSGNWKVTEKLKSGGTLSRFQRAVFLPFFSINHPMLTSGKQDSLDTYVNRMDAALPYEVDSRRRWRASRRIFASPIRRDLQPKLKQAPDSPDIQLKSLHYCQK